MIGQQENYYNLHTLNIQQQTQTNSDCQIPIFFFSHRINQLYCTTTEEQKKIDIKVEQIKKLDKTPTKMQSTQSYQLSRYRYVNLIVYILACAVNSLPIQTFASINSLVQNRYQYLPEVITLIVLLGPIMHPFMATPCNWILDRFGVRIGCSFGGLLLVLGVWARTYLIVGNPFWPILGAILAAMGNVFILSSPSAFALKWFPSQSVPKVIAITVLFNFISSGTGASIAGLILHQEATAQQIQQFLIIQAIIVSIPFVLLAILYRQTPNSPPSRAAAAKDTTQKEPYTKTIKKLFKNSSYMKTILSMSFSYGIFISFVSILDQSLATLGYSNPGKSTSATIGSAILVGTASALLFTWAIRKTNQYRNIISLCLFGAVVAFGLLQAVFLWEIEAYWVIGIMGGCAGFFVIPLTALFTTYSAELTYPVGQGSATGYLFAGSQTVGFISGMIWIIILDKTNKWKVYVMFAVHTAFLALALIISLWTKQHLNKTKYEQSSSQAEQKYTQSLLSQNNENNPQSESQ